MPLRILVVPDKFKGCLTASEAAQAIAQGWTKARPEDSLDLLPMSDGGDGFGPILSGLLRAREESVQVVDAAHRPVTAAWWWAEGSGTAVLESAQVIGLARLPPGQYHPFALDTYGLGSLLREVAHLRPRRCLIGIGGSATNDGGFGMACGLGWQFYAADGSMLSAWTDLHRLAKACPPSDGPPFQELSVAVDVANPLLGPHGATRVYGPQKGLRPVDFERAEACLAQLATVLGRERAEVAGAGAAGGLGFGLMAFAGARLQSGFELFSDQAQLRGQLRSAQLVITGEGALDPSSLMGKGVGRLAELCREYRVPCLALAGQIAPEAGDSGLFVQAHAIAPRLATAQEAQHRASYWLSLLAEQVARTWS